MTTPSTLALCKAATNTTNAAILLYRMSWWSRQAKIKRDGELWYARSRSDWMIDTGLTLGQYNRALAELKSLGLVETRQMIFRGKAVTHCRIVGESQSVDTHMCPERDTHALYKHGEDRRENIGDHSVANGHEGEPQSSIPEEEQNETWTPKLLLISGGTKEGAVKVSEFVRQAEAKPRPEPRTPQEALREAWRSAVAKHHKTFVPALTGQQMGQLKHFARVCPEGGL